MDSQINSKVSLKFNELLSNWAYYFHAICSIGDKFLYKRCRNIKFCEQDAEIINFVNKVPKY